MILLQSTKNLKDLSQIMMIIQQYDSTGINILDALKLYESNCEREEVCNALKSVRNDVNHGMSLPDAFAKHPALFPNYIVEMMRLNEGTGQSQDIYSDIVSTLEQEIDLRRNLGSQFGQLSFLGILLMIAIGLVVFIVIPNMIEAMSSLQMELPSSTRAVIFIGKLLEDYWFLWILMLIGAVSGLVFFKTSYPAQFEKLLLAVPLYNRIVFLQIQYRFALVFGLCKAAGLDTIKSLEFTRSAADNILLQNLISKAIAELKFGTKLSDALIKADKDHILDSSYNMVLKAGEQSDLGELLRLRMTFFKKELITASTDFSNKLNNYILVPFFVILGLIVFSVYQPIFSIMFQVQKGGLGM